MVSNSVHLVVSWGNDEGWMLYKWVKDHISESVDVVQNYTSLDISNFRCNSLTQYVLTMERKFDKLEFAILEIRCNAMNSGGKGYGESKKGPPTHITSKKGGARKSKVCV